MYTQLWAQSLGTLLLLPSLFAEPELHSCPILFPWSTEKESRRCAQFLQLAKTQTSGTRAAGQGPHTLWSGPQTDVHDTGNSYDTKTPHRWLPSLSFCRERNKPFLERSKLLLWKEQFSNWGKVSSVLGRRYRPAHSRTGIKPGVQNHHTSLTWGFWKAGVSLFCLGSVPLGGEPSLILKAVVWQGLGWDPLAP